MNSIREIREIQRLSQVEVGKRLGIDTQNYHRLEKRGKKLTIEQLENISVALEVSVFFLLSTILGIDKDSLENSIKLLDEKKGKKDVLFIEQMEKIDSYGKKIDDLTERLKKMQEGVNKRLNNIERNNPK